MKVINLTPHALILIAGETAVEIPPSGVVARVEEELHPVGAVEIEGVGIPVVARKFGKIVDLPEPQPGVLYAVSAIAAEAAWSQGRKDVVVTGDYVRSSEGRIVGARVLIAHPEIRLSS